MAVTGHHARLGTRLLAKLYRGRHFRRLGYMRFQGATRTDPGVLRLIASSNLVGWKIGISPKRGKVRHVSPIGHEPSGFDEWLVWVDRWQSGLFG